MDTNSISTVSCYAITYLGHFEGIFSIVEGAELPEGFVYEQPPLHCPSGFIQEYDRLTKKWTFVKQYIRDPYPVNEKGEPPSLEELIAFDKKLIAEGLLPDEERIFKELFAKRCLLQTRNEERMKAIAEGQK